MNGASKEETKGASAGASGVKKRSQPESRDDEETARAARRRLRLAANDEAPVTTGKGAKDPSTHTHDGTLIYNAHVHDGTLIYNTHVHDGTLVYNTHAHDGTLVHNAHAYMQSRDSHALHSNYML